VAQEAASRSSSPSEDSAKAAGRAAKNAVLAAGGSPAAAEEAGRVAQEAASRSSSPSEAKKKKGNEGRKGLKGQSPGDSDDEAREEDSGYLPDEGAYPSMSMSSRKSMSSHKSKFPIDKQFVGFKFADSPYKAGGGQNAGAAIPRRPGFHEAGLRSSQSVPRLMRDASAVCKSYQNVSRMLKDPRMAKASKKSVHVRVPGSLPAEGNALDEDDEDFDELGELLHPTRRKLQHGKSCPDLNTQSTGVGSTSSTYSDGFESEAVVTLPDINKPRPSSGQNTAQLKMLARSAKQMDGRFKPGTTPPTSANKSGKPVLARRNGSM